MSEHKIEKILPVFFSLLTILLVLLKIWPFAIVTCLFPLYYFIMIKFDKKLPPETNIAIGVFFIISVYMFIRYFYIKANNSLWYYPSLAQTSELINSDFINLVIMSLYVVFTFAMFSEMKKSRIASQRPNIIARAEQEGEWSAVYLIIRNIGGSPAFDVKSSYSIIKNDNTKEEFYWSIPVLQSMEKVKLMLDNKYIHNFYKDNKQLKVEIKYTDKEKNSFREALDFDLKELLKGIEKTMWAIDKDREYEISTSLKTMSKEMKKVSENLKYISYEHKQNYNKKEKKRIQESISEMKKRQEAKGSFLF